MDIKALFITLAVLWALLHLQVLPWVKNDWKAADLRRKMTRAGALVVVEKLRDLAAVGTCAVGAIALLVVAANFLGGAGVVWPKAVIEALASIYKSVKQVADDFGTGLSWAALAGGAVVLWLSARKARQHVVEVWQAKANEAHEAFRANPERIGEAAKDPELLPIVQQIDAAIDRLRTLHAMPTPDPGKIEDTREALGAALTHLAIESARKQVDFVVTASDAPADPTAALRPWQRVLRALSSKRFSEDMGLVRKPLGRAVTALLFVSLLGWASVPMADSLQLAVNNLRAQLLAGDAQRDLDQALSRAEPTTPVEASAPLPAESVRTASRLMARAVMTDLTRAPLVRTASALPANPRAQADAVAHALAGHVADQPMLPDTASRISQEAAATADRVSPHEGAAVRQLEERAQASLQQLKDRQPKRFAALLERLEARYAHAMSATDAQSKLVAKVLDEAFGGLDAKPDGELAKQGQKLAKEFGKDATKAWADARLKQFMSDTIIGTTRPEVRQAFAFEASESTRAFVQDLEQSSGRAWRAAPANAQEARMAQAVANRVADLHGVTDAGERAAMLDTFGGYERVFVADVDPRINDLSRSMPPTAAGGPPKTGPHAPEPGPAGAGGGGGGGGGHGSQAHGSPSRGWASNFHTASRSFRVRGVLIGRDLAGQPLDVTDIRWRILAAEGAGKPTRVALELRVADKPGTTPTWQSAGTFDAGVLNQALRYAADKRVVATTIMGGDRKAIGRMTYLHPALVDTPLGCRVIESDRLIDTFTTRPSRAESTASTTIAQLSEDRRQMDNWRAVVTYARAVVAREEPVCPADRVQQVVDKSKTDAVRFSEPMKAAMAAFLRAREASSPAGSTTFLKEASACATGPRDRLGECLCTRVSREGLLGAYWFPEDHTSQVREREGRLAADLRWLRPSPSHLEALDFWTHTTFSLHGRTREDREERESAALDFPNAQLQALRGQVQAALPAYATPRLKNADDFMDPLEQFVLAQRLARAALQGQLGADFPVTQLLLLQQQTRPFVPSQVTLRWEPAQDAENLERFLASADKDAVDKFRAHEADYRRRTLNRLPICDRASL
ncbi:hypothetical protein ACNI65_00355 [Roseateles sp. So40a]|uniref:hypothetical protein n=1 Tax=Roseateles sp. So40a TaxID=3400226 RepID=UPI003A862401